VAVQVQEAADARRHTVSLEEFERMVEADVFAPGARIELIEGEILDMAPINYPHEACVGRLTRALMIAAGDAAYVWPQNNSIRIPNNSRPQPDITLLKWRDDLYSASGVPPTADDVLLVVEVSDSSLKFDRREKLALYAGAGIPDYWIANLRDKVLEIYSDPEGGTYRLTKRAGAGDTVQLPGGLAGVIFVDEIFS
jgi:Uma2 family endonuclease